MANRNTLHKNHLEPFKLFLRQEGIATRPGKGVWQILQVQTKDAGWQCVFNRADIPEHYTVQDKLYSLVQRFLNKSEQPVSKASDVDSLGEINFKLDLILDHFKITN